MTDVLDGPGVRLRPARDDDAEDMAAAISDPLVRRYLPWFPQPFTAAHAREAIAAGGPERLPAGAASFTVADPDTDRLLGGVWIRWVVPERQQGEVGYWVAPWARGRGVATAAVRTLASWSRLARLEILTEWGNAASQRVALAAGFRREGVRRAAAPRPDGSRADMVVFARLAGDPPGPAERLLPDLPGGSLTDGVVTLLPLRESDADVLYALHTVPDIVATSVPPVPPEPAETRQRCERAAARWLAGERAEMLILDAATGAPAGDIQLNYLDQRIGEAMVGYSVFPAWRGRGYAGRALQLLALWAFAETGIARLIAGTLPTNTASQRVLVKAGFRREGLMRSRLPTGVGRRADDVQFALVADDLLKAAAGSR